MLEWFRCPDNQIIPVKDCLTKCKMDERCLTLPTLKLISTEREWNGVPSTTQLINGTMMEFLKLTKPYVVDPDSRAFMLAGTRHHQALEKVAKELGLPSEVALNMDRDIFDLLEPEPVQPEGKVDYPTGKWNLTDYKLWGSYRVAKALGIVEVGKQPSPNGEVYKSSGRWGKAGSPKMIPVFQTMPQEVDNWEAEYQLNRYRIMLEERGIQIKRMQLQITVRDGGLAIASSRGLTRNTCRIAIPKLDDQTIKEYFAHKEKALLTALEQDSWDVPCNDRECWEGNKCQGYCDVAMFCPKGLLHQQKGK